MKIVFSVRCTPIAQPRQRHRIVQARGRQFVQNYTPADSPVTTFKDRVRFAAKRAYRGEPLPGPLVVEMVFVMPRPQSAKGAGRSWHAIRPDADNIGKACLDALKNVAWLDDAQVSELTLRKQIAAAGEEPSVSISIEELQPAPAVQRSMF